MYNVFQHDKTLATIQSSVDQENQRVKNMKRQKMRTKVLVDAYKTRISSYVDTLIEDSMADPSRSQKMPAKMQQSHLRGQSMS